MIRKLHERITQHTFRISKLILFSRILSRCLVSHRILLYFIVFFLQKRIVEKQQKPPTFKTKNLCFQDVSLYNSPETTKHRRGFDTTLKEIKNKMSCGSKPPYAQPFSQITRSTQNISKNTSITRSHPKIATPIQQLRLRLSVIFQYKASRMQM